ncbi:hypothetical protein M406DRAFT_52688 [Cryphonectria parasitica EP155]|uniref:Wax synthase domain-containing protein n=1 Tax=Cryphonectria parasitica (strain ATCC 38755 / EP155) TaxID=660469 RepID=A0A9P4XUM7_CRYP1|nr:uncharacterized protein M406DRAFT_52688 [Cryphonectria parasitica EP155]KAF3761236.1 hypothetical protein M406DRAFT_52688 [Cryphonectria parasitica EP155]
MFHRGPVPPQLFNASDLLLVLGIDAAQLSRLCGPGSGTTKSVSSAVGLLFNSRRVGTPWQVKNTPSNAGLQIQSRTAFIFSRIAVTMLAYLFIDIMTSLPPPDLVMVRADKGALFPANGLRIEDIIFRVAATISYWVTTGIVLLAMNNVGAIIAVLTGLSRPGDCPPPLGPFTEGYTVRRFWGISWHQMLRSFLTGHADLIINKTLPFLPRHSAADRYIRLTLAFLISGLIHRRGDQAQGVPDAENGALAFFLSHAAIIMLEDCVGHVLAALLPRRICYVMGYLWVLAFFAWTSPTYMYPGMRLGFDGTALLPIRVIGPYLSRS